MFKTFYDFINEEYSPKSSIERFYMLVKKPYPKDLDNEIGKMIGDVRDAIFDQIVINKKNYKKLVFDKNVPILNFAKDEETTIDSMIKEKIIEEKNLYNKPEYTSVVSDKVVFHKTMKGDFIPKTVFSVKDASILKFPIIAKPAYGNSAIGIQRFDTFEDLEKSKEKFDVYSEMIDIKKEYRCFCFKDQVIAFNERIKVDKKDDFLKDAKQKTDFYYKKLDIEKYTYKKEFFNIMNSCKKQLDLDYFSIDFAEEPSGDLFLIEINGFTGMGVDKMVELYKLIYKDFYKKEIPKESLSELGELEKAWDKIYDKTKLNECTTVAGELDGTSFLFKNRDRSFLPKSVVVHEKVKGVEVVYYSDQSGWIEGMNEHGVGYVFSQLTELEWPGFGPSYRVTKNPKGDGKKFDRFHHKILHSLTAKSATDLISKILDSKKSGSFLIADQKSAYELEVFKGKVKKRKLSFTESSSFYVKTNHGEMIKNAGHQETGDSIKRASSDIRRYQAELQLTGIKDISEIPLRMKFQEFDSSSPLNVYRTDVEENTISQCLMDLTNLRFYFFSDKETSQSTNSDDKIKDGKIQIVYQKT